MTRAVLALLLAFAASLGALFGMLASGGGVFPAAHQPSPPSFADIVARANPAVVHVAVVEAAGAPGEEEAEEAEGGGEGDTPPDPEDPTQGFPAWRGPRLDEGSGFVVDPGGYILTNHHLVTAPNSIRVRFADRRELPARLLGSDPSTDLALLKVEAQGLPALRLGDSDRLRVGEWVCAIGNPYRFDHSVTVGVVSSKGRKIWDASFDAYIQTDAAINPGNSGGPLLNGAGEVVGVNAAVSLEAQGIGFAIPINLAREVLEQLRTAGRVTRGYLGVQLQDLEPDLQKLLRLPHGRGAVVVDVLAGGAGEAAGLRRYDVITAVSDEAIADGDRLVRAISARAPGSSVALRVLRDGRELTLSASLSEREALPASPGPAPEQAGGDALGLETAELAPEARAELRLPEDRRGVVVRDVVSPAVQGVDHGDLILEVNRRPTRDAAAYRKAVERLSAGESAWLLVYRPRPAGLSLVKLEVAARR